MAKLLEIEFYGIDESKVFLVCCIFSEVEGFGDGVSAFGVVGVNGAVVAINDINIFVENEVPFVTVPLMSIHVDYHYLLADLSTL